MLFERVARRDIKRWKGEGFDGVARRWEVPGCMSRLGKNT